MAKMKKHIPKETATTAARGEVGSFDGAMRRGSTRLALNKELRDKKAKMMADPAIKQQVRDYMFGNAENPFEALNEAYDKKIQTLCERPIKADIVGETH